MPARPIVRFAVVVLPFTAAACASSGTAPVRSGTETSTIQVDGVQVGRGTGAAALRLTRTDAAVEATLSTTPERAFAVLPDVYETLGLKINVVSTDTRTVGVNRVQVRRIGREALSRSLACGNDAVGTPIADSYAVTLTVMSRVSPVVGGGSLLSTQVIADARPISTSGNDIACQSTGALEERIASSVAARSASAPKP